MKYLILTIVIIGAIGIGFLINTLVYLLPNQNLNDKKKCFLQYSNLHDLLKKVIFLQKKSKRNILIEVMVVSIFLFLYLKYGFNFIFLKYATLSFFIMLIALIDLDTKDVYTSTTYTGIAIALLFLIYSSVKGYPVHEYLLGGFVGFAFIAIIAIISGGIGWGDADILLLIGLNTGLFLLIKIIIAAFAISGVFCVYRIISKKSKLKDFIPLGPFLAIGVFINILI